MRCRGLAGSGAGIGGGRRALDGRSGAGENPCVPGPSAILVRQTRHARGGAALRRSQAEWKAELDRIGNDRQRVADHYRRRFDALTKMQAGRD